MKILLFLLFAAQLSAQNITVFCGTQNQAVTPEVAAKFNLKNSDILTLEDFREVYAAMHPVEVSPSVYIGDGTPERPYRLAPVRPGEKYRISNDTIYTKTGKRYFSNGKWIFQPVKTPAEMIKEVAEAIREEDPKTAAMLYVILGSLQAKDPREKENLFELLILVAKSREGQ